MPSAVQVKTLVNSHYTGDNEQFNTVALQIAASEARQGHEQFAKELERLVDGAKKKESANRVVSIHEPQGELRSLLSLSYPKTRLSDMVLSESLKTKLDRILLEQRNAERIEHNGLSPRRKLILVGPPGTGKTMTASALAGELGLPLFQIRLDGLISKYLGETASKLRLVFEAAEDTLGVYFFDEFDAVGAERGLSSDVGEARRILNSFLMMLEESVSSSLILAATNHPEILDTALYRRFDDVLTYEMPDEQHIVTILKDRLSGYTDNRFDFASVAASAAGLSYAEITKAAEEVIKTALIEDRKTVTTDETVAALKERTVMTEQLRKLTMQR